MGKEKEKDKERKGKDKWKAKARKRTWKWTGRSAICKYVFPCRRRSIQYWKGNQRKGKGKDSIL